VRSVDGGGGRVWVGGTEGRTRVYEVTDTDASVNPARPLSPSMLSAPGSPMLGNPVEEVVVAGAKAVDRLVCLAPIELGLILSGKHSQSNTSLTQAS